MRIRRRRGGPPQAMRPAERYLGAGAEEARRFGSGVVGTEHVLLALTRDPEADAARCLLKLGVTGAALADALSGSLGPGVERLDREALASLGIDLDAVRHRLDEAFGPGALERTGAGCLGIAPELKRALEAAVEQADGPVGDADVLAGLLRVPESSAARVLARLGVTIEQVRPVG